MQHGQHCTCGVMSAVEWHFNFVGSRGQNVACGGGGAGARTGSSAPGRREISEREFSRRSRQRRLPSFLACHSLLEAELHACCSRVCPAEGLHRGGIQGRPLVCGGGERPSGRRGGGLKGVLMMAAAGGGWAAVSSLWAAAERGGREGAPASSPRDRRASLCALASFSPVLHVC